MLFIVLLVVTAVGLVFLGRKLWDSLDGFSAFVLPGLAIGVFGVAVVLFIADQNSSSKKQAPAVVTQTTPPPSAIAGPTPVGSFVSPSVVDKPKAKKPKTRKSKPIARRHHRSHRKVRRSAARTPVLVRTAVPRRSTPTQRVTTAPPPSAAPTPVRPAPAPTQVQHSHRKAKPPKTYNLSG